MIETITLSQALIKRCWDYAVAITDGDYAQRWPASAAFSILGAEKNPKLWAASKMAEMGFAIWASCDPLLDVNLDPERGPDQYDVKVGNILVDVKDSNTPYLIWSVKKGITGILNRRFHCFVAATTDVYHQTIVLHGWIGRIEFVSRCRPGGKKQHLIDGTPFVPHEALHWMADFPLPVGDEPATGPTLLPIA